ncbi:hypothetical protein [Tabrizicola sp.]|uniref:hypothetical protein n=1 Tax=Tabrizicola sp. TaxID=2005166 RepID=UPI00286CC519|nr:hypothetical protein [Tabrizicola sp.]
MSAVTIQQMADRVAQLMEERLAIRGRGLATKLRRAGRGLPRRVRDAGAGLAEAAAKARNPKLLGQIDMGQVSDHYDICVRHLITIDPTKRRREFIGGVLSSAGLGLLIAGLGLIAFLVWRGYL